MSLDGETLRAILNSVPFVSLAVKEMPTPLATRLIESGIMAVAAIVAGVYVAVPLIQKDIEVINKSLTKMDAKIEKVDNKVEKLREDLYAPKGGWKP